MVTWKTLLIRDDLMASQFNGTWISLSAVSVLALTSAWRHRGSRVLQAWEAPEPEPSMRTMRAVDRPLYKKNASDKFFDEYNKIHMPIAVVIAGRSDPIRISGKSGKIHGKMYTEEFSKKFHASPDANKSPSIQKSIELAQNGNAVLLVRRPFFEFIADTGSSVPKYEKDKPGEKPKRKPGKLSPMTPFMLLHRWADSMVIPTTFAVEEGRLALSPMHRVSDLMRKQTVTTNILRSLYPNHLSYNVGVGTKAGRLRHLASLDEARSDLWANYLLEGRVMFRPYQQPRFDEGPPFTEDEMNAREQFLENVKRVFPVLSEMLPGTVTIID